MSNRGNNATDDAMATQELLNCLDDVRTELDWDLLASMYSDYFWEDYKEDSHEN